MKIEIPYPGKNKVIDILDENIMMVGTPKDVKKVLDIKRLVLERLRAPIGSDYLSSVVSNKTKISILVDDVTRRTPVNEILPVILDELLEYGVLESNITIWIAIGIHREMSVDEQREKVGAGVFKRFKVKPHNYADKDNLVYRGKTSRGTPIWLNKSVVESDVIIGIGGILFHWFAGYGGGAKIILPGICGRETVLHNHNMLDASCCSCRMDGNPLREEMEEVARVAGLFMKLDCVMNTNNELVDLYAGDFIKAHRIAVQKYNEIYGVKFPHKAEIVLTSMMPKYHTFTQGVFMPLCSMFEVTEDNATIIIDCPSIEGYSFATKGFAADMKAKLTIEQLKKRVEEGSIFEAISLYHVARIRDKRHVIIVSKNLTENEMIQTGFKYSESLEKAIDMALEQHGRNTRIAVIPYGFSSVPIISK